jgi:hypothetical protein
MNGGVVDECVDPPVAVSELGGDGLQADLVRDVQLANQDPAVAGAAR